MWQGLSVARAVNRRSDRADRKSRWRKQRQFWQEFLWLLPCSFQCRDLASARSPAEAQEQVQHQRLSRLRPHHQVQEQARLLRLKPARVLHHHLLLRLRRLLLLSSNLIIHAPFAEVVELVDTYV